MGHWVAPFQSDGRRLFLLAYIFSFCGHLILRTTVLTWAFARSLRVYQRRQILQVALPFADRALTSVEKRLFGLSSHENCGDVAVMPISDGQEIPPIAALTRDQTINLYPRPAAWNMAGSPIGMTAVLSFWGALLRTISFDRVISAIRFLIKYFFDLH